MPFHSFTALKMPNYGKFSALSNSTSAKSFSSPRGGFGKCFLRESHIKKRAELAFTSAKVCHASKSCSRGRFYAISYTLKKRAEPAFNSAEVRHTSKSCSRGRFLCNFLYVKRKSLPQGGRLEELSNLSFHYWNVSFPTGVGVWS